jgi:hypothetical protein
MISQVQYIPKGSQVVLSPDPNPTTPQKLTVNALPLRQQFPGHFFGRDAKYELSAPLRKNIATPKTRDIIE